VSRSVVARMRPRRVHLGAALMSAALAATGCEPPAKTARTERERVNVYAKESQPELLIARGDAFVEAGELVRAEQYYALALREGATDTAVIPRLLSVCVRDHRYHEALEYGLPALRRNPSDFRLRKLIAAIYRALGQPDRARDELAKVVADQPDDASAHWVFAELLHDELHDPVGADREYRAYLRLAPTGPHAEEAKAGLLKEVVAP
jgi:tetratricopeptide (TPR) repeat protein